MKITFLFIFLIMFIVLALFVLLYYLFIKKSKKIPIILGENSKYPDLNSMTIVYNSLLCWILLIVNKITIFQAIKIMFIAIYQIIAIYILHNL